MTWHCLFPNYACHMCVQVALNVPHHTFTNGVRRLLTTETNWQIECKVEDHFDIF